MLGDKLCHDVVYDKGAPLCAMHFETDLASGNKIDRFNSQNALRKYFSTFIDLACGSDGCGPWETPARLASTTFFLNNIFLEKSVGRAVTSHAAGRCGTRDTVHRHIIAYDKPTILLIGVILFTVKQYCLNLRTGRDNVRTANDARQRKRQTRARRTRTRH